MSFLYVTVATTRPNVVDLKCPGCGRTFQAGAAEYAEAQKRVENNVPLFGWKPQITCSQQCIHGCEFVSQLVMRNWLFEHPMMRREPAA